MMERGALRLRRLLAARPCGSLLWTRVMSCRFSGKNLEDPDSSQHSTTDKSCRAQADYDSPTPMLLAMIHTPEGGTGRLASAGI